ncbi:hypothetical protein ACFO7V_07125 [Glutamicibacter bergerei]|uniref:TIGR04086 family membrane protein n=1 Tax=Glutamicibacter bergerei TaxID=256702 RepID=A0ABV9MIZ4_9MICC|nr:hypothetical protein [Glutamicibacter sp. BW80]HBV10431.1 hypothetical protein [Micrococcaceae bacterium]
MRETELKISRVIINSLLFSTLIPLLIVIASLLDPEYNSISQAFLGYIVFYAPFSLLGSVALTAVSVIVFMSGLKRWRNSISALASFVAVSIVGLLTALAVGQFQELDILSVVIAGTCLGSLAGPIGALTHKDSNVM